VPPRNERTPSPYRGASQGLTPALRARRAHPIPADRSGNRWRMGARQCAGEPVLMVPAWRQGWRTMAQDLAKSSSRTRRKQRRALRVDRFGSERTQKNEVLSRKTGRQAKFCRTSDQNFLDAPRATKFIVLQAILQQILAFPPSMPGPRRRSRSRSCSGGFLANPMRWRHDLRRPKAS
jgi:hypothetical protein